MGTFSRLVLHEVLGRPTAYVEKLYKAFCGFRDLLEIWCV